VLAALEAAGVPPDARRRLADPILSEAQRRAKDEQPAHRALDDARCERDLWSDARRRAEEIATDQGSVGR
jgi:hypothetical protein